MTDPKIPLKFSRRQLLAAGAALPLFSIVTRRADAAEFELKYATGQDPTHPVNLRAKEAHDRIREATSGRVNIKLFPANQLGSDTDLLTQVRNGSVDFFNLSSVVSAKPLPAEEGKRFLVGVPLRGADGKKLPPGPEQRAARGWLSNQPPPMFAKNTPRMPPMTPTGVSAASINGNRSSASANTAFCPENCR